MAVRIPAKYDGTNIVEMTTGERTEWHAYIAYLYAQAPTVTLTVVSGSGTLTPGLTDTRMKAGAASQNSSAFVAEGSTAEPATVTGTAYDKITGPTYNTDGSAAGDLGAVGYPLYINGDSDLQVMTQADYVDTFIYATLDAMIAASETAATNGTYTIATAASVTNYTEVSGAGTAVFIDTRADTSAYAASGIPETLDQPTTVTSFFLQRQNRARAFPSAACLFADSNGDISQGPLAADDSTFNAALAVDIKFRAAEDDAGHKLSYNINGSGNTRGTAIVDTRLDGAGNYQTRQVSDDYRSQEFPNGSAAVIGTNTLKIVHV
tara:strand:+ start:613 stop:1575 length:963 start_codon:yes stop_codon:yes gene_type:complete